MKRKHRILLIIGGLLISVMVTFSIGIPLITNIVSMVREILPADTTKLVYMDEDEKFVDIGRGYNMLCAVSDQGNCYVNGMRAEKNTNFGLEDYITFNHASPEKWVQIYGNEDAVSVDMFSDCGGGCIFTANHDVYLFLNGSEAYRTPTYLCSGYVSADKIDNTALFLLSEKNELVQCSFSDPTDCYVIGKNVKKFRLGKQNDITIFALTEDNKLFILKNGEELTAQTPYIDHIIDFDFYLTSSQYCVLSLLTDDHMAFGVMGNYELSYEVLSNEDIRIPYDIDIVSVTSYSGGIAMLDKNADVKIYGTQITNSSGGWDFRGESVFHNVSSVCGDSQSLCVIKKDGSLLKFGHHADVGGYDKNIVADE